MKDMLIILGAGGHGKVVADIAIKMNRWKNIVFFDDKADVQITMGLEVLGNRSDLLKHKDVADFFVAIGNNATREMTQEDLMKEGLSLATLIHPNAILGTNVEIGMGTAVMAGVVINTSTHIGKGCIINTSSSLDHDNVIEDFAHISPGVMCAGTIKIGRRSWLGIGSVVSNNINICSGCIIGAGAVVVSDISESGTYVGVPARRI
jgi:sugar O-acyltransferase (sialic acid O-acetyltransferase NeuD family)